MEWWLIMLWPYGFAEPLDVVLFLVLCLKRSIVFVIVFTGYVG